MGGEGVGHHAEGFTGLTSGRWNVVLREGMRGAFRAPEFADPERLAASGDPCFRGRGRPCRVALPGGGSGVLRVYRHGGMLRAITGRRFLGVPRPLDELRATEAARRAGVRVPEVLAAWYRFVGKVFHEGWILTREIEGATDLLTALSGGSAPPRIFRALGEETRKMHDAGVWHADLHVKNVLLTGDEVTIIDFDRARVTDEVSRDARIGNLLRFDRSVAKLGRSGVRVPAKDRMRFFHGYRKEAVSRGERAEILRRCERSLRMHARGWSLFGTGRS
ncbi:MAG: lipopolysaccharide kinase InaA family protein [Planctomycetota bacterium]